MPSSLSFLNEPLLKKINDHLIAYPVPTNLNYFWSFGSLAGLSLVIQIITGIFLACHYTPEVNLAFSSVEHICRDVQGGFLLRFLHANGAGLFFTVTFFHILRGLFYGSYQSPREGVWVVGVVILLLMIATGFFGYSLPFGQQSYWALRVITSLFSIVPIIGTELVEFLWGGFSVNQATLNRFFSLHYLLPFLIAACSIVHIAALHAKGSNNPLGINASCDKISFYPYLVFKDRLAALIFLLVLSSLSFFAPNLLSDPDNYIPANSLVTPLNIVPEFYFLIVYCILRSIPNKTGGVLAIGLVFVALFSLPFLANSPIRSSNFRPLHRKAFYMFVSSCLILSWAGAKPVEQPYILIGQLSTFYFFLYFFVLVPCLARLEYYFLKSSKEIEIDA